MISTSIAALLVAAAAATTAQPPAPAPAPAAAPAPQPVEESAPTISLPTLARSLEEDLGRVRSLERVAQPSAAYAEVVRDLPPLRSRMTTMEASLLAAGAEDLTFRELDVLRFSWQGLDGTLARWEGTLEHDATIVDEARRDLAAIEGRWRTALEADWRARVPQPLVDKIGTVLTKSAAASEAMVARLSQLLVVQDEVASGRGRVRDAMDRTQALSAVISERLFAVEQNTLWAALAAEPDRFPLARQVVESWHASAGAIRRVLAGRKSTLLFQLALFAGLVAGGFELARRARRDPAADGSAQAAAGFLAHPAPAAGMLAVFSTFLLYPPADGIAVREAALTLLLIPYILLVPKVAVPPMRGHAYGIAGLFLLDRLHDFALPHSLLQRVLLLAVGVLGVVGWAVAYRSTVRAEAAGRPSWTIGWKIVFRAAVVSLAVAVVANVVGNVSLAEQLTVVAVKGTFAGTLFYLIARILEAYWVLLLRALAAAGAPLVVGHRPLLERRGQKIIRAAAAAAWGLFLLWIMRIVEQSGAMIAAFFSKRWTVGHVEIGLGALVAFATALTIGIVAARLIRFVLDEALFPRMSMPRGVPAAISTTVGYLIVCSGVVMAFLAAGLEMSQFTFLAGAFGVGIGFGLQNVVNNFVSGLILLYERPIQVGDVLTVGTVQGRVRRIGIRSSTLATFDGAEVIVPNATLIATDVVNWTLSDRLRRIDIKISAGYGSDPQRVLDLLLATARGHKGVLQTPAPAALFMGFGENGLDFELRLWTPDYDAWLVVASELRTGVLAAFRAAGIEIPFPQRDVRLVSPKPAP